VPQGRVTYYNQAAADLAGRRPELGKDEWCVTWRLGIVTETESGAVGGLGRVSA